MIHLHRRRPVSPNIVPKGEEEELTRAIRWIRHLPSSPKIFPNHDTKRITIHMIIPTIPQSLPGNTVPNTPIVIVMAVARATAIATVIVIEREIGTLYPLQAKSHIILVTLIIAQSQIHRHLLHHQDSLLPPVALFQIQINGGIALTLGMGMGTAWDGFLNWKILVQPVHVDLLSTSMNRK